MVSKITTPHGQRMTELIEAAAEALDDLRDPFSTDFLVNHKVTRDECVALSETMGLILHGYLLSSRDIQMVIIGVGAVSTDPDLAPLMENQIRANSAMKAIQRMGT